MSVPGRTQLPESLRRVIDGYRRRWRAVRAQTGMLATLGVLACGVGAAVAADRLLRLSPTLRAIALTLIAIATLACLARWVAWPALRRLRDRDAAAHLGHSFPAVEEDMVSAVELSSDGTRQAGISEGLIRSALRHIAQRARSVDYRIAVPLRPVLVAGASVLAILVILTIVYHVRPEACRNALARLLRPNADVPFFCYTRLRVDPGDHVVRIGDSVDVAIATSGRPARLARVRGRKGDGSAPADRISARLACTDGAAHWNTGPLFKDMSYRVWAGDAMSDWRRIRVVPAPALTQKAATLTLPKYAGSGTQTLEKIEGPLHVVRGTQVVLRLRPVDRGDDPRLRCFGQARAGRAVLTLTADKSGTLVSEPFTPSATAEYTIELTDGFGLENRAAESVFVKVSPDRKPVVAIEKPGRDLLVLTGETVAVKATARDEFGIRRLQLCLRTIKGSDAGAEPARWQRRPLADGAANAAAIEAETTLSVDGLALIAGDVLEYRGEAADFADDEVLRRGYSPTYRLTVLTKMEHLELVLARLKELQLAMLRRAAAQRAQAAEAASLAEDADAQDAQDEARAAQDRQLAQAQATRDLARKLESLIPELARNDTTPTDMLTEMERLGRGVRSVAQGPMQNAAEQFGRAAQGAQPQQGQPSPLLLAEQHAGEAGRRLEQLSQLAERMQRRGLLEKLASEAEALAVRQRGLKDNLLPLARKTIGTDADRLDKKDRRQLKHLVTFQRTLKEGVDTLGKDIEKASATLSFSNPEDAATAEKARAHLEKEKVADRTQRIADRLEQNALFAQVPEQESVARSLTEVADILRERIASDSVEAITRAIEEFIQRQKAINGQIQAAIDKKEKALRPAEMGANQSRLQRDVSELAAALHWLAREIALFRSQTAAKLDAAGSEMASGSSDLFRKALPEGLEHGKRALAILEDARDTFSQELQQMQQAMMNAEMMEALFLLQRCIVGQTRVNRTTQEADSVRRRNAEAADQMALGLSRNQAKVHVDATELEKRIKQQFPNAAQLVGKSAEKMDLSRIALGAADTGTETRQVQKMALALLERLLADPQSGMGGAMAGARAQAMMQMMAAGASAGGFTGGTNAPIMPATLGNAKNEDWRRVRSRFDEQLGAAADVQAPSQYRGLLDAYFDRLRKEPPR